MSSNPTKRAYRNSYWEESCSTVDKDIVGDVLDWKCCSELQAGASQSSFATARLVGDTERQRWEAEEEAEDLEVSRNESVLGLTW